MKTRTRLLMFLLLSFVLHALTAGTFGLPAYLQSKRQRQVDEQRQREQAAAREAAAKEDAAAAQQAREATRNDVAADVHKEFRNLVRDELPEALQSTLWSAVQSELARPVEDMAAELGRAEANDSDLLNLKGALDQKMVEALDSKLQGLLVEAVAADALANVKDKALPAAVALIHGNVESQIAPKVAGAVNRLQQTESKAGRPPGDPAAAAGYVGAATDEQFRLAMSNTAVTATLSDAAGKEVADTLRAAGLPDQGTSERLKRDVRALLDAELAKQARAGAAATSKMAGGSAALGEAALGDNRARGMSKVVADEVAPRLEAILRDRKLSEGFGKNTRSSLSAQQLEDVADRVTRARENRVSGRNGGTGGQGGTLAALRDSAMGRAAQGRHVAGLGHGQPGGGGVGPAVIGLYLPEPDDVKAGHVGARMTRAGATGEVWRADAATVRTGPERVLVPPASAIPVQAATNAAPFVPGFQSVAFAAVPFLRHAIRVDGELADWADIPVLTFKPELAGVKPGEAWTVEPPAVKLAWDNAGLYVSVQCTDADKTLTKATLYQFFNADGVELWIDALNAKTQFRNRLCGQQFWIWPENGTDPESQNATGGESLKVNEGHGWKMKAFGQDQMPRGSRRTDRGWQFEARLPLDRIKNLSLYPGRIIGFNMTVLTGTPLYYYWAVSKTNESYIRPDTWGDLLLAGSDGRIEALEHPGDVPGTSGAGKPANHVVIGDYLRLRVVDPDMNLDPQVRDKVAVSVTARSGDRQTAILEETGSSTGVFEGALRTGYATGEPVPGMLSLYDGEDVAITYLDQARANGARNADVQVKVQAAGAVTTAVAMGR